MMEILYTDYLEIPAPLSLVNAILCDPATWHKLPTGATHLGAFWRGADDLYTVTFTAPAANETTPTHTHDHACYHAPLLDNPSTVRATHILRWHLAPVTNSGFHLTVEVALFDVVVATHAFLRVIYSPPTSKGIGLFSRWRTRRTIAATIHACHQALTTLVLPIPPTTAAPTASDTLPLVERLRLIYPQTVATFAAMGASDELERVWRLEQAWHRTMNGAYDETLYELHPDSAYTTASSSNDESNTTDFDLIYAGGGARVVACCGNGSLLPTTGDGL